ncbi:MAG: hypothetical protein AAF730_04350, partial [Bacteroidota bacterium]
MDQIQEFGEMDSDQIPPYVFTYVKEVNGVTKTLPVRLSNNYDHWGYANGSTNDDNAVPEVIWEDNYYAGANREPDFDFAQLGTLQTIQYPTGGTTTFEYEAHEYGSRGGLELTGSPLIRQRMLMDITSAKGQGDTHTFTIGTNGGGVHFA